MRRTRFSLLAAVALLAKVSVAAGAPVDAVVQDAIAAALAVPEATVRVVASTVRVPDGCRPVQGQVDRPITASGGLTMKLQGQQRRGTACEGWARVVVSVTAPVMITTRVIRAGEPLDSATTVAWREITPGLRPAAPASGGIAARTLMANQVLDVNSVRANRGTSGGQVKVTVRAGALTVEQTGRLIQCGGGRTCAVLPSGKHVEGFMENDRLVVMSP